MVFRKARMNTQTKETPSEIAEPASLKEVRQKLGKTQAQIATEIGFKGYMMICQIEKGQRPIPKSRIESFTRAYGVSVEQLNKLWAKRTPHKRQSEIADDTDVLPIIKAIADCGIAQLTLGEFQKLLGYTSHFKNCTPGLIKEILTCGFK